MLRPLLRLRRDEKDKLRSRQFPSNLLHFMTQLMAIPIKIRGHYAGRVLINVMVGNYGPAAEPPH